MILVNKIQKRFHMKITHITVHCSATKNSPEIDAERIRKIHKAKGWSDIGYHYVVNHYGIIEKGRSEEVHGAHVKGHNTGNIGVCLIGGVNESGNAEFNFSDFQMNSLRSLVFALAAKHGVPIENIIGHRDWYGDTNNDGKIDSRDWLKECPCFDVQAWLWDGLNKGA